MSLRFSIVTPVYDPPAEVLRAMIRSVSEQTFSDWELCLVDDCSPSPHVAPVLREAAAADPRVRVSTRVENGGIVAASNDALAMAEGEFVVLLDHDDELAPSALAVVDRALAAQPDTDYLYTDEDKIDDRGRHGFAFYKPDWSPERLRTQMYTCHLSVLRRALVEEVGGFRAEYEGSQDWDLVLRVTERARGVVHVPEVLYHWRMLATSAAGAGETAKPWAYEAGTRAIQAHCDRTGFEATVEHDAVHSGIYHLRPRLRDSPLVSIVIPTGGRVRDVHGVPVVLVDHCVESIVTSSTYDEYEIVCVVDDGVDRSVIDRLRSLAGDRLTLVHCDTPFNFSERINRGVLRSVGEHVLFLNDDMEVVTPDWLERLLMYSRWPEIGAVGAKLLYSDGTLQHAGVTFDEVGPGHVYRCFGGDHGGYFNMLRAANNFQAVTGACLMTRRSAFDDVGGLSTLLPLNFNDVDYCLKLRNRGLRSVVDPDTVLYHFESSSRPAEVAEWEVRLLGDRHSRVLPDPYYNPNLLASTRNYVEPVMLADGRVLR
jgi:O-antigen biosynthesis protein